METTLPPFIRFLEGSRAGRSVLRTIRWVRSRPDPSRPKVLCVGNLKTGTSSFGMAMRRLEYSHYGYDEDMACEWLPQGRVDACLEFAARFDSFDDRPWSDPRMVTAFADRFPGSLYVLLERDADSWTGSYRAHFRKLGRPVPATDEELLRLYEDHNRRVVEAVAGKGALLRMNVCAGEGYEVLCPFLGLPVVQEPFPKVNQRIGG